MVLERLSYFEDAVGMAEPLPLPPYSSPFSLAHPALENKLHLHVSAASCRCFLRAENIAMPWTAVAPRDGPSWLPIPDKTGILIPYPVLSCHCSSEQHMIGLEKHLS